MTLHVALAAFAALLATATPHAAAQAPAAPPGCNAAEHRQFDFWVGDWDVFRPDGQKVGENRIEAIAAGCGLLEHWAGRGGVVGKSLNAWSGEDRRWHQTWVDASGGVLRLAGRWTGEAMELSGEQAGEGGRRALQRIRWTPAADGTVRQLWESSADGGGSWKTEFDGRYVRRGR